MTEELQAQSCSSSFVIRHSSFVVSRYTAAMRSQWKRFRYRLEWIGLRLAIKLVPLLSRKTCFHLAQFLGGATSILDRARRKVALSNLEAAFGDQLSAGERRKIVRQSFQHFARTMLDFLWSPRLT